MPLEEAPQMKKLPESSQNTGLRRAPKTGLPPGPGGCVTAVEGSGAGVSTSGVFFGPPESRQTTQGGLMRHKNRKGAGTKNGRRSGWGKGEESVVGGCI